MDLVKPNVELHNCQECGKEIPKKSYESRNRYRNRKYCSTKCAKDYMRKNKIGWFNPRAQTIKKDKDEYGGLPPFLWSDKELAQWKRDYPELENF